MVLRVRIRTRLSTCAALYRAGSKSVTSTSNTRKIILTRKNLRQNGRRLLPEGSNPHSKGEDFSASATVLNVATRPARIKPATARATTEYANIRPTLGLWVSAFQGR